MKTSQMAWLLGVLCVLFLDPRLAAQATPKSESPILLGTFEEKTQERHVYKIDPELVAAVLATRSAPVKRAFIAKVKKKDCCNPVKVSSHVWKCCDGTYLVTNSVPLWNMVAEAHKVTDAEWKEAESHEFFGLLGWEKIAALLASKPPVEIEDKSALVESLAWKEIPGFKPN